MNTRLYKSLNNYVEANNRIQIEANNRIQIESNNGINTKNISFEEFNGIRILATISPTESRRSKRHNNDESSGVHIDRSLRKANGIRPPVKNKSSWSR